MLGESLAHPERRQHYATSDPPAGLDFIGMLYQIGMKTLS